MRRAALVILAACAALLSACGGNTAQEDAYLADLQRSSSQIELADPGTDVDMGHEICDLLKGTKPADRYTMMAVAAENPPYNAHIVLAATEHLCPEYKGVP